MTLKDALYWDLHIQPSIASSKGTRADRLWNWTFISRVQPYYMSVQGCTCQGFTIKIPGLSKKGETVAIPAAMALLVDQYPFPNAAPQDPQKSEFIWFVSSAPKDRLRELGAISVPSLGRALVDVALVTSVNEGLEGRAWLHAAAAGKDRLIDFYENVVRFKRLPPEVDLPVRRSNDGRFFFSDPPLALSLLDSMDNQR